MAFWPKNEQMVARRLDVDSAYICRILRLTTLAPGIVAAILQGREPSGLSLAKLTRTLPEDWADQHEMFFTAHHRALPHD